MEDEMMFTFTTGKRHVEAIKTAVGIPMYRVLNHCGLGIADFATWCDATLDAAAPDLLHALYTVLPFIEDAQENPVYKSANVAKVVRDIRAAIAKAEGR